MDISQKFILILFDVIIKVILKIFSDLMENYCAEVSALHTKMLSNPDEYPTYEPDIHYPKLIILTKVDGNLL